MCPLASETLLFALAALLTSGPAAAAPDSWIPAWWQGGPLEVERRIRNKTLPADTAIRDSVSRWYEPETLDLLDGSPVNCLLVTWSAGADADLEREQHQLVKAYGREAHARGIAVLGVVYPGSALPRSADALADACLDGLVVEGELPSLTGALVIPLVARPGSLRFAEWPVFAVQGVWPRLRPLSEKGVRAGPTSEPWIESNIWLVRSIRAMSGGKPVWVSHQPVAAAAAADYVRAVADSAIAGGRWIVALDDVFRMNLRNRQPEALETWKHIGEYLKYYEERTESAELRPIGALGVVLDSSGGNSEASHEYLRAFVGRKVPYRLINRAQLTPAALAGLTAVFAAELDRPSDAERKTLRDFAESGGLAILGHGWGSYVAKGQDMTEVIAGKGRLIVYGGDLPDPEFVFRIMRKYLDTDWNVRLFNMSSLLTYGSATSSGNRILLRMLNYSTHPAEAMTVRVKGSFGTARLYTPEAGATDLTVEQLNGRTEISIPKLLVSGTLLLEK